MVATLSLLRPDETPSAQHLGGDRGYRQYPGGGAHDGPLARCRDQGGTRTGSRSAGAACNPQRERCGVYRVRPRARGPCAAGARATATGRGGNRGAARSGGGEIVDRRYAVDRADVFAADGAALPPAHARGAVGILRRTAGCRATALARRQPGLFDWTASAGFTAIGVS